MERRYELRDDQWNRIKELLPTERKMQGGRPAKDNHHMLNAMLWVIRSGAPWHDLPDYFGPLQSVYTRFRRWEQAGIFDRMLDVLSADPIDESVLIDASMIRVHQHGAGAKGGSNYKPSVGREEV
jgi:transposase